jgi:exodeoxyribonuclease V beta subunit
MSPASLTDSVRGAEDEDPTLSFSTQSNRDETIDLRLIALERLKGPRFGNAVHHLLELGRGAPGASFLSEVPRIAAALEQEAVLLDPVRGAAQLTAVAELLDRTLDSELAPGLRLSALADSDQRAEFEFAFALDQARWGQLHGVLQTHGYGHWWPADEDDRVLRGLMKGYLDLVFAFDGRFHVLDYKTNWLGSGHLLDYAPAALDVAMQDHHYGLQALIYTVALHRYLGQRIPNYHPTEHLGESWYLFVRAVGLSADAGIWRRRFPQDLIDQLDTLFDGEEIER